MSKDTKIAWCDSTFNPFIGCTKIGPGCDNCYAEVQDGRKRWGGTTHWGAGVPRYRTSASNWAQPLAWNKKAAASGKPWRVFCASLADVFDNEVPAIWRHDLWKLILDTPRLSWLLVTKRIGNVIRMVPGDWHFHGFPFNVRLLITVCNQEEAERDIPKLLALPCKNGISYEPALGAVDWTKWLGGEYKGDPSSSSERRSVAVDSGGLRHHVSGGVEDSPRRSVGKISWLIIGGESGSKARPFEIAWAHNTIAQCKDAGTPVFMKQMGTCRLMWSDRAGANPAEWPIDLRVREFPK